MHALYSLSFILSMFMFEHVYTGGNCGAVVTHSPSSSEVGGSNPGPYDGKLVVAYQWLACLQYRTLTICMS